MNKIIKILFATTLLLICNTPVFGTEFAPYGLDKKSFHQQDHYDSQEAAKVPQYTVEKTDCISIVDELVDSKCKWLIKTDGGTVLKEYEAEDLTVETRASARYQKKAYALIEVSCDGGDDCKEAGTFLLSSKGLRKISSPSSDVLDLTILPGPTILALNKSGLKQLSPTLELLHSYDAPKSFKEGQIGTNLSGDYSAIALAGDRSIWLYDGQKWSNVGLTLPKRADRSGILASYPHPEGGAVGVVYKYEGVFKKGLRFVRSFGENREPVNFPIYLSSERNVGWDPEVFVTEDRYRISATDSTYDKRVYLTIPLNVAQSDTLARPKKGSFTREFKMFSFFTGAGVEQRDWLASSTAQGIEVDYNFESSLLKKGFFQGRIGNTRLALSYLEQFAGKEAEKRGGKVAGEGISYLTGTIDFQKLFSSSSGLRLQYQKHATNGLATVLRDNGSDSIEKFSVDHEQYGLYNARERGNYIGLKFSDYSLPSAVNFSDSTQKVVHSAYSPDIEYDNVSLVWGYDPRLYAERYETDYAGLFLTYEGGIGMGRADIPQEILEEAKMKAGKDEIKFPYYFLLSGTLETGYMFQSRSSSLKGLGVQTLIGYRATGQIIDPVIIREALDHRLPEELFNATKNELAVRPGRTDLTHGPFININILF